MKKLLIFILLISSAKAQTFSNPPANITVVPPSADDMMINYNRIVSDGNTAFTALQTQINSISGSPVPSGMVIPFNLSTCPAGWKISNGTSGTADLRGRFPRVATGAAIGVSQTDQFTDHVHTATDTYTTAIHGSVVVVSGGGTPNITFFTGVGTGAPTGTNVGAETRPMNVALIFCEKN